LTFSVLNYKFVVIPSVVGKDHFGVIGIERETEFSFIGETKVVYSINNYDSLPSNKIDKQIIEFTKLKSVEMFLNKLHKEDNTDLEVSFRIINSNTQTQFNGYDCGVFTCMKAMDFFSKKDKKILDQTDALEFRREILCMLIEYVMKEKEEERVKEEQTETLEEASADVLSENNMKLLDDIKTSEEKIANAIIIPEAIIKTTKDKITTETEVRHNSFQNAIESYITIEAVRANLKLVNDDNFTNLCCKEFIERFIKKPPTQNFMSFLKEVFTNLTEEIEAYFNSDKIQKMLKETYIERLSNTELSKNLGFVEKEFVKMGSNMEIKTNMSNAVLSPTKKFLDFPESIYNNPISLFDEIENKFEDLNVVSSALMLMSATEDTDTNKETSPENMKKNNIIEKKKSLKKKVYLLSFRIFEAIAVKYLDEKGEYDVDTTKCLNILKGYSRINSDTNIDYFSAFVLAAFENINCDPRQNEYVKLLLHLVTEKKGEATVNVERLMDVNTLRKKVENLTIDDLVENYKKMRLRTPKEKKHVRVQPPVLLKEKKEMKKILKIVNFLQKKLKQVK